MDDSIDQWLLQFLEDNWVALVACVVVVSALQLYWFLTAPPPNFLSDSTFQDVPLLMKKNVTYNTLFLRFKLPDVRQKLGLPVGQHIVFKFTNAQQEAVFRPYTPVSHCETRGHVDFVIKVYPKGVMSQHMDKLDIGDRILMKGPKGSFHYRRNMKKKLGMLAGGTGITPMYQVLNHILKDPRDKTQVSLIYANVKVSDILLKKDLDRLATEHSTKFEVYYTVSDAPADWTQGVGFISAEMIKNNCPKPADDVLMLYCGPPPMCNAMAGLLDGLGYTKEMQFKF